MYGSSKGMFENKIHYNIESVMSRAINKLSVVWSSEASELDSSSLAFSFSLDILLETDIYLQLVIPLGYM